ncbi:hypothetical protein KBB12_03325 [Candidatus Woesebacteria bacterium]|nr:hypothetical protein [Candidatus Woesebacteria bacterium]
MDTYSEIAHKIITAQRAVLGPVALKIAQGVGGLDIRDADHPVVGAEPMVVLTNLVSGYSSFFGKVSVEVCKEAAKEAMVNADMVELPEVLKSA